MLNTGKNFLYVSHCCESQIYTTGGVYNTGNKCGYYTGIMCGYNANLSEKDCANTNQSKLAQE